PGAITAQRQPGEIDAFAIDLVLLLHPVEDAEGSLGVRSAGLPVPLLAALREDHEERELLVTALELDGVADALLDRPLAVVAALAGAMQEQDHRVLLLRLVIVRHEDDILRIAVLGLEDLVNEPVFAFV